jgi:NAD(P)-dependent dehydrogenase (short-subunit alcohol dehydrogenase family)
MSTKGNGWSRADIPHLTGVTAVVTGSNSGIALEAAAWAHQGAPVVATVRRTERDEAAAAAIRAIIPANSGQATGVRSGGGSATGRMCCLAGDQQGRLPACGREDGGRDIV